MHKIKIQALLESKSKWVRLEPKDKGKEVSGEVLLTAENPSEKQPTPKPTKEKEKEKSKDKTKVASPPVPKREISVVPVELPPQLDQLYCEKGLCTCST